MFNHKITIGVSKPIKVKHSLDNNYVCFLKTLPALEHQSNLLKTVSCFFFFFFSANF